MFFWWSDVGEIGEECGEVFCGQILDYLGEYEDLEGFVDVEQCYGQGCFECGDDDDWVVFEVVGELFEEGSCEEGVEVVDCFEYIDLDGEVVFV